MIQTQDVRGDESRMVLRFGVLVIWQMGVPLIEVGNIGREAAYGGKSKVWFWVCLVWGASKLSK